MHTDQPWELGMPCDVTVNGSDESSMAEIYGHEGGPTAIAYVVHDCDVPLILAAPDLLAALENLRNEVSDCLSELARHQVDATPLIGAKRKAERVIKKARGA